MFFQGMCPLLTMPYFIVTVIFLPPEQIYIFRIFKYHCHWLEVYLFIIIIETILIALCHESLVTDKNIKIKKILTFVTVCDSCLVFSQLP